MAEGLPKEIIKVLEGMKIILYFFFFYSGLVFFAIKIILNQTWAFELLKFKTKQPSSNPKYSCDATV